MGNMQGALQALGGSFANIGANGMSAHIQQMRDARMAKYRQQEQQQGFLNQKALQDDNQEFQGDMGLLNIQAKQKAAALKREQDLADQGSKQKHELDKIILKGKVDPSATKITNNLGPNETAYNKEFSKLKAKQDINRYTKVEQAVSEAADMDDALTLMEELSATAKTGATPELLAKAGQFFGTDAGAAMQTFQSASTPIVLGMASKLSGVISDRDMKVIEAASPNFGNDPRANKIIIGQLRKAMKRTQQNYDSMNTYIEEKGTLNGWTMPNRQGESRLSQSSIDAANNPGATIKGFDPDEFSQFEAQYGSN